MVNKIKELNTKINNLVEDINDEYEKKVIKLGNDDVYTSQRVADDLFAFAGNYFEGDCSGNNTTAYNSNNTTAYSIDDYKKSVEKLIEYTHSEKLKEYIKGTYSSFTNNEIVDFAEIVDNTLRYDKDMESKTYDIVRTYIKMLNEYYVENGYIEKDNILKLAYKEFY